MTTQQRVDVVCPGWGPHKNQPIVIGHTVGTGESHGMCPECREYMEAEIERSKKVE